MKICVINGSPRNRGATGKILTEMIRIIEDNKDAQVEYFNLSEENINYCNGCMRCNYDAMCTIKNDREAYIFDQIRNADAIIIGSPTYASNISGQLKTFIDRGNFVMYQDFVGKSAFSVVTYANAQGNNVMRILNHLFIFSGAILCGHYIVKTPFNKDPLSIPKNQKALHLKTQKFLHKIQKQKKPLFQKIIHGIVFHMGIKPYVIKNKKQSIGLLRKWKMNGIMIERQ